MGTDIHAFIEFDDNLTSEPFAEGNWISSLSCGEFCIQRNYDLFDALGNGRNYHFKESEIQQRALYPPRGVPANLSEIVISRYYHLVDDNLGFANSLLPVLPSVTGEQARLWVKQGVSHCGKPFMTDNRGNGRKSKEIERRRVSDPAWHSASWLTLAEVYDSLAHFNLEVAKLSVDFQVILGAMNDLATRLGAERVHLVFWFDN